MAIDPDLDLPPSITMVILDDAIGKNERIFLNYKKNLSTPEVYLNHVERFTAWVKDARAYYPRALPEVC